MLSIEDLKEGMKLSGTVRNVVDFGAFVDIGVKQDGLVHVSKLSKKFVKNPMDIVSVGDIVDVWVYSIDKNKDKVSLTMIIHMNNDKLQRMVRTSEENLDVHRHCAYFNKRLRTTGGRYLLKSHDIEINSKQYEHYGEDAVVKIILHELCHYHLHLLVKVINIKIKFLKRYEPTGWSA